MKIAVVAAWTASNHVGGVENHIASVFAELRARHEIRVFSSDINQRLSTRSLNLSGLVQGFIAKAGLNLRQLRHFRDICVFKPDVVHQHDLSSSLLLMLALRLTGHKLVLTNHTGEYLYAKRLLRGLPDAFLKFFYSGVIGPSTELTPRGDRCVTIHNGYDEAVFRPLRLNREEVLGDAAAETARRFRHLVLVPRRWAPTKGVIFALQAAALMPDTCFLFAGSDYDNYPEYKRLCLEENARNTVGNTVLLGDIDQSSMSQLLNVVDAVLMPSLVEAVSLSAVEANACGRPLMASNVPGNAEIIIEGLNGFLFVPSDAAAIKACLDAHMPAAAAGDFRAACLRAVGRHTWKAIAARTEQVLDAVSRNCWTRELRDAIDMSGPSRLSA